MYYMMAEFFKMTMGESLRKTRLLAIATGMIVFLLVFFNEALSIGWSFIALAYVPLSFLFISFLTILRQEDMPKSSHLYTGLLYIAIPLILSNQLVFSSGSYNGWLAVCFFVIIWLSDVGAYSIGTLWGQNHGKKLAPSISPKKSWIGFWGGLFFALLAATGLHYLGVLDFPLIHCLLLAAVMHVAGVAGDLYESKWKRYFGIKDSGDSIPGHGGMLDRFDSTLFAFPAGIVYLVIFNLL